MNQSPALASIPAASAVALSNATPANVRSMTLGAGTYLVWGVVNAALAAATVSAIAASLSLSSGALASQPGQNVSPAILFPEPIAQRLPGLTTATGTETVGIGPTVVTVLPNQTATLYLVAQASFSAGSVGAYGTIFAMPLPTN